MAWNTGNPLRAPVLCMHDSIVHHATLAVKRAKTVYGFNQGYAGKVNKREMEGLRIDTRDAVDLVEKEKRQDNLRIPNPVREGLLGALETAKNMLQDPDNYDALAAAYPDILEDTISLIDSAQIKIDNILNPPQTIWRETSSGELQGAFEF